MRRVVCPAPVEEGGFYPPSLFGTRDNKGLSVNRPIYVQALRPKHREPVELNKEVLYIEIFSAVLAVEAKKDGAAEMERVPFMEAEIGILAQAIEVSEELISDSYKISTSEWKRYRYDIQSLSSLLEEEITDVAFAQIRRYLRKPGEKTRGSEPGDFFKICIQDHVIRMAVERDSYIALFPLTTYVVIHELIHVVRFAKFVQRFDSTPAEQDAEEKRVHAITFELLQKSRMPGLPEVLTAFKDCRTMENFLAN